MDSKQAYIGILVMVILLSIMHQHLVSKIIRSSGKIALMILKPIPKPTLVFRE